MVLNYFKATDGFNYIDTFNREWIEDHKETMTGPVYCDNCVCYGSIDYNNEKIFIGYCLNCAYVIYKKERGPGFQGFRSYDFNVYYNCKEMNSFDWPEYLYDYIEIIKSLVYDKISTPSLAERCHWHAYKSRHDITHNINQFDCDCDCDCESIDLSEMDSDIDLDCGDCGKCGDCGDLNTPFY